MHNSESSLSLTSSVSSTVSKHNSKQINTTSTKSIKNQLSKSSSFKENKQISLNTTTTATTSTTTKSMTSSFKKPVNKRLSAENPITLGVQSKPKTILTRNVNNTLATTNSTNQTVKTTAVAAKTESVKSFSSTTSGGPIVNMTKAAQLRANSNKKTAVSAHPPTAKVTQSTNKQTTATSSVLKQITKTKDNILTKMSSLEAHDLNSSGTHFVENPSTSAGASARRQSFSFGCNSNVNNKMNTSCQAKSTAIKTDTFRSQTNAIKTKATK